MSFGRVADRQRDHSTNRPVRITTNKVVACEWDWQQIEQVSGKSIIATGQIASEVDAERELFRVQRSQTLLDQFVKVVGEQLFVRNDSASPAVSSHWVLADALEPRPAAKRNPRHSDSFALGKD